MAKVSVSQLKKWFQAKLYPKAEQFWDWMDSYWHKDEKIPIDAVDELTGQLNDKYSNTSGTALEQTVAQLDERVTTIGQGVSEQVGRLQDVSDDHEERIVDLEDAVGSAHGIAQLEVITGNEFTAGSNVVYQLAGTARAIDVSITATPGGSFYIIASSSGFLFNFTTQDGKPVKKSFSLLPQAPFVVSALVANSAVFLNVLSYDR